MGNYYVAWQVPKICRTQLMVHNVALNSTQLNQSVSQSVRDCVRVPRLVRFLRLSFGKEICQIRQMLVNHCAVYPPSSYASDSIPSQSKPSSSLTLFTSDMVYHTTPHSLPLCRGRELLPLPPRVAFVCGLPVGISAPC